jgi:hypothetical protein
VIVPTVDRGLRLHGLLVDADRGGEALGRVDVRLLHLTEELAGVSRQTFDVPPLALGEEGIERE